MESISIFDIIKVGIGPSSSHTMGPWEASLKFCNEIVSKNILPSIVQTQVTLYGSLAKTGKGHGTDFAITLGLAGYDYKIIDTDLLESFYTQIKTSKKLNLAGKKTLDFNDESIKFESSTTLEAHPNGMKISAILENESTFERIYYSIGGGFILEEGETSPANVRISSKNPCHSGEDIIKYCNENQMTLSQLVLYNETTWLTELEIKEKALNLWEEIQTAIWRGCNKGGILPGYLQVKRRANDIFLKLNGSNTFETKEEWISFLKSTPQDFNSVNKWVSCFALAVNEENASYGRIITAPTNGAAGVIPAVLMYAYCFLSNIDTEKVINFILTAGEIGTLFKKSATISAAMGGCQAEIGVSSAMAAGALTEILGGSTEQVLMAAEIAMEHHLGLTCDPVGGLVQIPCIERNTMGAIKAITASNIALESDPKNAKVSLDNVIKTMWQTALDMNSKYKETSEAGLATNISVNISEC